MFRRIATIRDQAFKIKALKQVISLGDVMALATTEEQAQRIAQTLNCDMDFATETASTASQSLFTVFFRHLPHRDAHAQWCCPSCRFPDRGHPQSKRASVPRPHGHTSEQSAYRRYSSCRIQRAISAIGRRCDLSISLLRRNDGSHPRLPRKHAGLLARSPEFLSIDRRLVSRQS